MTCGGLSKCSKTIYEQLYVVPGGRDIQFFLIVTWWWVVETHMKWALAGLACHMISLVAICDVARLDRGIGKTEMVEVEVVEVVVGGVVDVGCCSGLK